MFTCFDVSTRTGIFNTSRAFSNAPEFKRYNLIYGFNGSGKSTLTRMIQSFALNGLSPNLPEKSTFKAHYDGEVVSSGDLPTERPIQNVLVYNKDFCENNLNFSSSSASSIVYLGEAAKETKEKLGQLQSSYASSSRIGSHISKSYSDAKKARADHFTQTAREIKLATSRTPYDAGHLKKRLIGLSGPIEHQYDVIAEAELILRDQENKPRLSSLTPENAVSSYVSAYDQLVSLSQAYQHTVSVELPLDLLGWIKSGLRVHEESEDCRFCSQPIPSGRIEELNRLVSKSTVDVDVILQNLLRQILECQTSLQYLRESAPESADLFDEFVPAIKSQKQQLYAAIGDAGKNLKVLEFATRTAQNGSPFDPPKEWSAVKTKAYCDAIVSASKAINLVLQNHNARHSEFDARLKSSQQIIEDKIIAREWSRFLDFETNEREAEDAVNAHAISRQRMSAEIAKLKGQLSNTLDAAEAVNSLLEVYFGHQRIRLVPKDTGYALQRVDGSNAVNLSEGEKTAISLCYFLSKLNEGGRSTSSCIIVFDDPISSMDSSAKNLAHTFISSSCKDAKQVFVLTHDMLFMNETKKWLRRKKDPIQKHGKAFKEPTAEFFQIATQVDLASGMRSSSLSPMSKLLSEYDSDYQYNFSVLRRNSLVPIDGPEIGDFYMIPNLGRKVLETFFAFKFPGKPDMNAVIDSTEYKSHGLCPDMSKTVVRFLNLQSHSQTLDSVTQLSEMNYESAIDAAKFVLKMIEVIDPVHFSQTVTKCRRDHPELAPA